MGNMGKHLGREWGIGDGEYRIGEWGMGNRGIGEWGNIGHRG